MMKIYLILGILLLLGVVAANIELDLPDGVQRANVVTDRIEKCKFGDHKGGKVGPSFLFVGIILSDPNIPYLRWNVKRSLRSEIEMICNNKAKVRVVYLAKRKLIRPKITYWIESLDAFNT